MGGIIIWLLFLGIIWFVYDMIVGPNETRKGWLKFFLVVMMILLPIPLFVLILYGVGEIINLHIFSGLQCILVGMVLMYLDIQGLNNIGTIL